MYMWFLTESWTENAAVLKLSCLAVELAGELFGIRRCINGIDWAKCEEKQFVRFETACPRARVFNCRLTSATSWCHFPESGHGMVLSWVADGLSLTAVAYELPWPSGYELRLSLGRSRVLILVKVIGGRQEGHPVQKCSLLQKSPN